MKKWGILFLAVISAGCNRHGATSSSIIETEPTAIFGGSRVSHESPLSLAVFDLRMNEGSEQKNCTAARISPFYLITAAHCVVGSEVDIFQNGEKVGTAVETIIHPLYLKKKSEIELARDWNQINFYDVALLAFPEQLEGPLFNLPEAEISQELRSLSVAGYGWESYHLLTGQREGEETLKQIEVSLSSGDARSFKVSQNSGKGICVGDSGAPAFSQNEDGSWTVLGIANSVRNPGNDSVCLGESRFLRIQPLLSWIRASSHLR